MRDVQIELTFAVVLVVAVIFLFLGDWRATLIPSLSVPLSLIGTLAVMYLAGFSLNNLSIMALTIATGFVVDDAIVMIENIARYIERGDDPKQAALEGSGQIAFTVVSLTVSLIAVLIPLLFMSDVVGRLFSEFAVTLSVTILISAVVSLTLVPMLCAQLLRRRPGHARPPAEPQAHLEAEALGARWFGRMISFYDRCLIVVFRHQPLTLLIAVGTIVLTVVLYIVVPKGFFPVQDTGLIQAVTEAPQSVSFEAMSERQRALADAILGDPDVESLTLLRGRRRHQPDAELGPHADQPQAARYPQRLTASQVIRRLQRETASVQGITLYMQPAQDLTIDSTVSRTQYQFVLESAKPERFRRLGAAPARPPAKAARDHRRDERPRGQGAVAVHQDRPRCRRALRHHRRHGRQRALRRVRPAHRVDGLHPVEPVSRDLRGRAVDGPLHQFALQPLPAGRQQQAGAAVGHRHLRGTLGAASHRPAGPVPGHHHLVQPGAGRRAWPGGRRHHRRATRDRHAGLDHARTSRAPRLPSRSRSTASCC